MRPPPVHDSFPRTFEDDEESLSDAYQEFGMRRASLRPPTIQTQNRLSNLSSISDWSRQTIGCMQQGNDLSWFRLDDESSSPPSRSAYGGGDKFIDLDAGQHSNGTSESLNNPKLTALPRLTPLSPAEDLAVWKHSDIDNPTNWKPWKKWIHVVVLVFLSFVASMGSLILAPAAPEVSSRLNIRSPLLHAFIVSVYVLGFTTGPLLLGPLSELYGRLPVLHISNWCLVGFTVACGFSQTKVQLIILRFFASALGTACLSIGGAIVSDLFPSMHRAGPFALLEAGRLVGWFVGPIVGGVIVHWLRWRWIFWILAMAAGFNALISIIFLRETYAPILLQRRIVRSQDEKRMLSTQGFVNSAISPSALLRHSILQPLRLLCQDPLVMITALYSATLSGILLLIASAIPFSYSRRYRFSGLHSGLVYIAPGVGMILGLLISGLMIDCTSKRRSQLRKAEDSIYLLGTFTGTIVAAGGLALYGWAARYHFHWIIPLVGLAVFGFGLLPLTTGAQSYLTEAYPSEEAGVMAANSIIRSLASGLLPLSGLVIYHHIGFGWGNTLLAGILGISILIPIFCKIWGEKIRQRFRVDT